MNASNTFSRSASAFAGRRILRWLLAWLLLSLSTTVSANGIPWEGERQFRYNAQGTPLKAMLRDLATSQGITAVVDADIEGTINGSFELTPQSTLDLLTKKNGLVWYFDGSVLHIQRAENSITEILRLRSENASRILNGLTDLNVVDQRFPITYDSRKNVLKVMGPRPYVEVVREAVRALDEPGAGLNDAQVKVFPLRYAWAADNEVTLNGRTVRIPGVVSLLNQLFPSEPSPVAATDPVGSEPLPLKRRRLPSGLVIPVPDDRANPLQQNDPLAAAGLPVPPPRQPGLPHIVADPMNNTVLVRDTPERMAGYSPLIARLDVRPRVLEIEARIIEVNTDAFENIGVDWRLRGDRFDLQSNTQPRPLLTPGGALDEALSGTGSALTTVLTDAGRFFIARVSLLESQGMAKTVSTPKIIALDNMEAVIQRRSTFYIRVAGNQDAAVFDVPVDTALRVTPRFVALDGSDRNLIRMSIRIDDGIITTRAVDTLPVTETVSVSTQAMIQEGQSLLIGGLTQERSDQNTVGVPVLSKLPGVGRLFRRDVESLARVERLFLLTPRLVVFGADKPTTTTSSSASEAGVPTPPSSSSSSPASAGRQAEPQTEPGAPAPKDRPAPTPSRNQPFNTTPSEEMYGP